VLSRRSPALLALALCFAAASTAAADTPLWEEATREGEEPERWVHATGFVQPALVLRLSDDDAPRQDHSFLIQRARLGVEAQPFVWARLKVDVAFAPSPEVNDAYVELTAHSALRVRLGRFRLPFLLAYGFDERDLSFVDRPLYVPANGPDRPFLGYLAPRAIGGMVSGLVGDASPSSMVPVFEYALGVFTGGGLAAPIGADYGFQYAGRVRLHALGYPEGADVESDLARNSLPRVAVGGAVRSSCVAGAMGDTGTWHRGFTADLEGRWRGAYLSGSFLWLRSGRAREGQLGYDACGLNADELAGDPAPLYDATGAHVQLQYVLPDLLLPKRHELELSARFDYLKPLDPDPSFTAPIGSPHPLLTTPSLSEPINAPEQMRLSFGLSWYPMGDPTVRVRLSYHHNRELEPHAGATGGVVEEIRNDQLWLQLSGSL